MTATVPPIIGDLTALCAFVVAVGAATALLWRTPPVRWFREQLAESFGGWMQVQVQEANKDHVEYVRPLSKLSIAPIENGGHIEGAAAIWGTVPL